MENLQEISQDEIQELHRKIADNVKAIRKQKNISQLNLAHSIGHKTVSTIAKIEAGHENKHYNIEQLYKIANVLQVDIRDFFILQT
ncbi:helix-turn-helix transcriptional regulator [Sulfurimonas crateris]|uniref:Helix-turn-helix transcriptional regulator n=1 Tax=Sulfurimonas crateris TaxID=2574727 RepID=A0A4U2ZAT1_9BACT|nr:MAG: transcriptional regulator [Sulfurimonas sp.]TKI71314.1 helix-turn-helix transcriptional regulator [Sulfurimonas crateris]